jgi:small subunit ribosomal protein S2
MPVKKTEPKKEKTETKKKKVAKAQDKNQEAQDTIEQIPTDTKSPKKPSSKALEALKEKALQLESKVQEAPEEVHLKEKVKPLSPEEEQEKKDTLVPIEDYLKASIHLGTRVITPDMRPYVYRRRADGLAVFNTAMLDDEVLKGAEYLSKFSPEQIIVVCKREAGWAPVKLFAKTLGIRSYTKKYPAGILTNPNLEDFTETDLMFICDPWIDKNALQDSNKIKIPVLSICDTNNYTAGINTIIPGNNKSAKSLGMIFFLLTKLYIEKRKLDISPPTIQEFIDDWDNLQPPK